jgi:catechol 2,3-dioxygenase-like lactoylglutathione lyase family enzyme
LAVLSSSRLVAFVATRDPARAKTFYKEILGLTLVADEPFALVFDAAGTMLRVAKVNQLHPAPYTVLGWDVLDIAATIRELIDRGTSFERFEGMPQDAWGVWASPSGARVAWFKDPDGNLLSLTQFPVHAEG